MFRFVAVASVIGFAVAVPYNIEIDEPEGEDLTYLGPEIFGAPQESVGIKLEQWNENSGVNPEELGEYAEGDILFPGNSPRSGLIDKAKRWEGGLVPYEISENFTRKETRRIEEAMEIFQLYTCIRFLERTPTDKDYLSIINGNTGCWSSIGKLNGRQPLNLQSPACTKQVGTVLHQLMHALGFVHEHSRWSRDQYVTIVWSNINKEDKQNFQLKTKDELDDSGVNYDLNSVMHISPRAFSENGKPTIIPKNPDDKSGLIGQRFGLSRGDINKINTVYKCSNTPTATRRLQIPKAPAATRRLHKPVTKGRRWYYSQTNRAY